MKNLKNILKLAVIVLLFLNSNIAYAEEKDEIATNIDGFEYGIDTVDNIAGIYNLEHTKLNPTNNYTHDTIIVPDFVTYNGKQYVVRKIKPYAFANCKNLKSIHISDSVKYIFSYSFKYDSLLTDVHLSNNIEDLYKELFFKCYSLEKIIVPASVKKFPEYYKEVPLTQLINSPFNNCNNLKTVIFYCDRPQNIDINKLTKSLPNDISTNIYLLSKYYKNYFSYDFINWHKLDVPDAKSVYTMPTSLETPLNLTLNDKTAPEISITEEGSISANKGTTLSISIKDSCFQFISLPFNCELDSIYSNSGLNSTHYGTDWIVKRFDGELHATYGTESEDSSINEKYAWRTLSHGDTLHSGVGYIIALDSESQFINATTHSATLCFPTNDTLLIKHQHSKLSETPTPLYEVTADSHNSALNPVFSGWNLLSPNLLFTANNTHITVDNQPLNYISIPNTDGYSYTQIEADDCNFTSCKSFFVQVPNSGKIEVHKNSPNATKSISHNNRITLSLRHQDTLASLDKTTLLFDDTYTTNYVINSDLRKLTSNVNPQIYTTLNDIDYAYNALPITAITDDSISLNLNIPQSMQGRYTITLDEFTINENYEIIYDLRLIDEATHTSTILSKSNPYTFNTNSSTNSNRFSLRLTPKIVDNTDDNIDNEIDYFVDNEHLNIINLKENSLIKLYSIDGKLIYKNYCKESNHKIDISSMHNTCVVVTLYHNQQTRSWQIAIP